MSSVETRVLPSRRITKSDVKPIWCPGCGDYHVLMSFTRHIRSIGPAPRTDRRRIRYRAARRAFPPTRIATAFTACTAVRLALAAGLKVTRPDLHRRGRQRHGDGYSIGGNHFLHACRRNIE